MAPMAPRRSLRSLRSLQVGGAIRELGRLAPELPDFLPGEPLLRWQMSIIWARTTW